MKSTGNKKPLAARSDVVWQPSTITREQRELRNGHLGKVVWLTGLPGSGKSTIAHAAAASLHHSGFQAVVLDGDNIRHGLCADLGFSLEDRNENIRRVGEVAKLFVQQGTVVFVALVSPLRIAREKVRQLLGEGEFIEVYCQCTPDVCKERDPKGMYAKAATGEIPQFTGVSSPYEEPTNPDLLLDTVSESVEESVARLLGLIAP